MLKIYKTTTCVWCKAVAKFLTSKGVEFEEIVLDDNPQLRQEVIEKSGAMSVPVIVKGDWEEFCIGWQPAKLTAMIGG